MLQGSCNGQKNNKTAKWILKNRQGSIIGCSETGTIGKEEEPVSID